MLENFNIALSEISSLKISPIEKSRMLIEKGVYSLTDLIRLSGAPCSLFLGIELNKSVSIDVSSLKSVPIGIHEIHFYEIISGLIKSETLQDITFVNTSDDFIKTVVQNFNIKLEKSFKEKGISSIKGFTGLNFNKSIIVLEPSIGGYIDTDKNLDLDSLSVKQLNLLYKGIVERNPRNFLLEMIIDLLKKKIN